MAFIETERLILRTWMPSDAPALYAIRSNEEVNRFLPGAAIPTLESISQWIARQMDEQEREGFSLWPAIRKEDGMLIGYAGLHRMPDGNVEAVWIFARDVWGAGYATEAARASIHYGRDIVRLRRIYALVDPSNPKSIAVAYRVGMRFDRLVRAYKRELLRYVI